MAKYDDPREKLRCSFCGRTQEQVAMLIQGPDAFICDECVENCLNILNAGEAPKAVFALADEKPEAVYAYCNLHGLWKAEI